MVKRLEDLSGEILTVIQVSEVVDEFITGHLTAYVLPVEVSVEEHQGTGQSVYGI